jgi:hypothetical protein
MAAKSCGILHRNEYFGHFGVNGNGLPSEEGRPLLQVTPPKRLAEEFQGTQHGVIDTPAEWNGDDAPIKNQFDFGGHCKNSLFRRGG